MKRIFTLFFLISTFTSNSQCIENLGPDDFNQASLTPSLHTDIAISSNNDIYIAYTYYITMSNPVCIVKKYSNNKWSQIGTDIPGSIAENQISIGTDGTPYVSFLYSDNTSICTYKFNGTNWINVGGMITNTNMLPHSEFHMELDNSNTPFIIFNDNINGKISVMKYNGSNWIYVGTPGISNPGSINNSITFDNIGTPFISYTEGNSIFVKQFDGANWNNVGGPYISLPIGYSNYIRYKIKIGINSLNELYLAYEAPTGVLLKFNGTTWSQVGSNFSSNAIDNLDMGFDAANNVYLSYEEGNTAHKISVSKFNGSSWSFVGSQGFSIGTANFCALSIDNSGILNVVYNDDGNMGKATVRKFNGSTWNYIGAAGFSDGPVSFGSYGNQPTASMATHKNGDTYVAYTDITTNYRTQVKKYDGVNWNVIGQAPINSTNTIRNQLVMDTSGVPYLLYEDQSTYNPTVVKYNGSSWVTVGVPNIVIANLTSIAINPVTNEPYIVFGDYLNSRKASVMRFNGSNWVNVGTPDFSNEQIDYTAIAFDPFGNPCIAFRDNINKDFVSVIKYDGTNWNYLNSPFYVFGGVKDLNLKINSSGEIYFVCRGFFDTYIYKFNGLTWQTIGNIPGATSAYSGNLDMALDKNGKPIIAYGNIDGGGGILISQYNGTNLNLVIPSEFSASNITNPMISTDTIGNIYVAYGADRLYAKKIIPGPSVSISSISDTLCTGQSMNLIASSTYSNYLWNTGSTNPSISVSPTVSTGYFVSAEAGGCKSYAAKNIIVNSCVGIEEYQKEDRLVIYPNPTSNFLNILFEQNNLSNTKLELINSLGQTILQTEVKNQIDVSELPNGFYFLKLKENSGNEIVKKIIISR